MGALHDEPGYTFVEVLFQPDMQTIIVIQTILPGKRLNFSCKGRQGPKHKRRLVLLQTETVAWCKVSS